MKRIMRLITQRIGVRITIAFLCILLLLIMQGGFAIYNSRLVVAAQRKALTQQIELMAFQDKLSQVRVTVFTLLGTMMPQEMELLKAEIDERLQDIVNEIEKFDIQRDVFATSQETYKQIIALHWDFDTKRAYELINSRSKEEYEALYGVLETKTSEIETAVQEQIRQADRQFLAVTLGAGVLGAVIALLWGRYLLRSIVEPLKRVVMVAQRIANGDLTMNIEVDRRDEMGQLLAAMKNLIEKVTWIVEDIDGLARAGQDGELSKRADISRHKGEFTRIIQGLNHTLDAFIGPVNIATEYMRRLSIGDIPQQITDEYQGDFDHIKQNLNILIDAMNTITHLAREMAGGNLTVVVNERSEQDTLMRTLNAMIQHLNTMVMNVKTAADGVAGGGQQMSTTAEQLAEGAAKQAAVAEEVATSMEEMVANIRQNADNALQTEKIASQSAEDARKSDKAVSEAVHAMKEIAKKISLIEEIAGETRMLSLNATIEAAKAQEYGKGFAVVAAEVRALANRSREAAEEISELANSGVAVAETAENMLTRLAPDIQQTAKLVQEISAASSEQHTGAEQINQSIQQLDQVIQQNATTSEEMASTAEELAAQAEQLQQTVAFFRINETPGQTLHKANQTWAEFRTRFANGVEKKSLLLTDSEDGGRSEDNEKGSPGGCLIMDMSQGYHKGDDLDTRFERY